MKKIVVILILLVGVSGQSFAEKQGWYTPSKIKRIVVVINGGINIKLEESLEGCTSLSGYGGRYASVHPDHPGLDRIYSLLLGAYMAEKEVQLYLSDDKCKVTEVVIGGAYDT